MELKNLKQALKEWTMAGNIFTSKRIQGIRDKLNRVYDKCLLILGRKCSHGGAFTEDGIESLATT